MKTFQDLLIELNVCEEAFEWAGNKTIEQFIDCDRGDWLLWLAKEIDINNQKLTLAKGHCANTVRHLMLDERSRNAVDTAIKYGEGQASEEELNVAYTSAADAYYDAYAYSDSSDAAYAAYVASAAAADAYDAAYASAVYVAVYAVSDTYDADYAKKKNQLKTANICRKYIGELIIERVNELLNKNE
jgi:hypothetical protein